MAETDDHQDLEFLRERYEKLREKKIRTDQALRASRDQLDELKRKAREDYQTDDLEELERMLQEMKADNDRRRLEYKKHLDEIESQLNSIQKDYERTAEDDLP